MKTGFVWGLSLVLGAANAFAAPAKSSGWEYAFVDPDVTRKVGTSYSYGVELRLHRRPPIFLRRFEDADSDEFLLDVFNRLGAKGWELVSVPSYRGPDNYVFKRRR